MAQNRKPPAYQEYAAAMMARIEYRTMSLAERGLLYTLRQECWVNHFVPENPAMLAKLLGFDAADVASALPAVLPFFAIKDGMISCPELEDYRNHINDIRLRQSAGGKKGAALTNKMAARQQTATKRVKSPRSPSNSPSKPSGESQVEPRVCSTAQPSTAQPSHEGEMLTTKAVIEGGNDDF